MAVGRQMSTADRIGLVATWVIFLWLVWGALYLVGNVYFGHMPFYWQGLVGNHEYAPTVQPYNGPDLLPDLGKVPGTNYWYCNNVPPLNPHHYGEEGFGDHLCTIDD